MKRQTPQKGFSLLEMLIVILIIGIFAIIVFPRISDTIRKYNARAEARELAVQFKKAKLAAVKHYRDVWITFRNVGGVDSGYMIFVNVDRDTNTPHTYDPGAGDILLENKTLRQNVQLISTTFTNNQAGYNSRGLPLQLSNQNIVLGSTGSRTYTLSVTQTGNVRIQ